MSAQGGSSRAPALGGQPSPSIGAYQESHNQPHSLHPNNSDNQLFHQQSINNSNYYQNYQNTQIGPNNQNNGLTNSHQHNAQYNPNNSSINSSSGNSSSSSSNNNSGQLQQSQQHQQSLAHSGPVSSNYNVNFTHGNSNNINMVAATGNQQGMEMGFNSQVRIDLYFFLEKLKQHQTSGIFCE